MNERRAGRTRGARAAALLEENIVEWLPATSLFIFVAYHGLRDTIASLIGFYSPVVYGLIGLAYLLLLVYWLSRGLHFRVRFVAPPVLLFVVFASFIVFGGADRLVFEDYALGAAINPMGGLIGYLFMLAQGDSRKADTALKASTLVMTVYLQTSLSTVMSETTEAGYSMGLGFDALLFAILALHFLIDDSSRLGVFSKLLWLACAVSNVALILSYGSRGPIIGLLAFAVLRFLVYLFCSSNVSILKKAVLALAVVGGSLLFIANLEVLASSLNSQLNSLGITSRTLEKFLFSNVTDGSGRTAIWNALIPHIGLFGSGPFSDQYLLGEGNYAHNFVLEVLYDFGIPIGIVLLGVFVWANAMVFRRYEKSEWSPIYLVFLSFCCGRLALSGTFWTETYFWMLLALIVLCLRDQYPRARCDAASPSKRRGWRAR